MNSLTGKTVGKYGIEGEIGRGGMGVVYQARQLSLNRTVALKVLPPILAADENFRDRFFQEAQAIASLSHENILHVYDIEEVDDQYFIVMELLDGETLRTLRERRRLTLEEVFQIGGAVARALDYAHERGIVHRDIKSGNVMITRDGRVKLMDFGIARVAGGSVKTQTGTVLGTPEYMAPEQARLGEVTPRTDLYSLGVLLYELATGSMPFTGTDAFSVALKHISEEPKKPSEVDPSVPAPVEAVILRAMAKDPEERFQSAGELAAELERVALAGGWLTLPASSSSASLTTMATVFDADPVADRKTLPAVGGHSPAAAAGTTYAGLKGSGVWRLYAAGLAIVLVALVGWLWLGRSPKEPGIGRSGAAMNQAASLQSAQPQGANLGLGEGASLGAPVEEGETDETEDPSDMGSETTAEEQAWQAENGESPDAYPMYRPEDPGHESVGREPESGPGESNRVAGRTPPKPSGTSGTSGTSRSSRPNGASVPAEVEPRPTAVVPAPRPAAPTPKPVVVPPKPVLRADYECQEGVEFHIDPEEADVVIDGRSIGISDDWDDMGRRGKRWEPGQGVYQACFVLPDFERRCVVVAIRPTAREEVCEVEVDLEEID